MIGVVELCCGLFCGCVFRFVAVHVCVRFVDYFRVGSLSCVTPCSVCEVCAMCVCVVVESA